MATGLPDLLVAYNFREGQRYTDPLYEYTFYHNGYWAAHGGKNTLPLPSAHQAWVVPNEKLQEFMELAGRLLTEPPYYQWVYPYLLLQDVTPVVKSDMWMSPFDQEKLQVYQMTLAVDHMESERARLAKAFLQELSQRAYALGGENDPRKIKVHILKETHINEELLARQYRQQVYRTKAFKKQVDPNNLVRTVLTDQLGLTNYKK